MKTRIVAMLVAAVMLFGMCSVAMAEDYTVNFLSCWSGASAGFPEDIPGNICAQLIAEQFGITLNEADPGGNMTEVEYLNMIFSSDNVPDAVNAPYWGPGQGGEGYVLINGAKEGMVKDIAPYLDQFPTLKAIYEEENGYIGKSAWMNLIKNPEYPEGAIYFIPTGMNMDSAEYQTVYGDTLYARQDVLDALGVKAEDITNAPTIYFPLLFHQAIMIEPTETESLETLDAFIAVMRQIAVEAKTDPEMLHAAPHNTPIGRPDETTAARQPILKY
ncbi:MAG: hypothetical protein K6E35_01875 [Bacteroidales bacterium]|nr:hypothetical protein [Bacteroidales bacterium]